LGAGDGLDGVPDGTGPTRMRGNPARLVQDRGSGIGDSQGEAYYPQWGKVHEIVAQIGYVFQANAFFCRNAAYQRCFAVVAFVVMMDPKLPDAGLDCRGFETRDDGQL